MYQPADRKEIQKHIMKQFGLPEDQVSGLLNQFFEAIAEHQTDFEQAVVAGNLEMVAKAAHKYKGALANLGIKDGAELTLAAELAAKNEESDFAYPTVASSLKEIISPLY